MLDNSISKPFGFAFIITAHMILNGPSQAQPDQITGAVGGNVNLSFKFNKIPNTFNCRLALYRDDNLKISQCHCNITCSKNLSCVFNKETKSAFYCIYNLTPKHTGIYWVTLFNQGKILNSTNKSLLVREDDTSSTVPPSPTTNTVTEADVDPSQTASHPFVPFFFFVLGVLAATLLTGVLALVIWSHRRTKEQQQDPIPRMQETVGATNPALVYSVLDFPKRHQEGVEVQLTDTEYATISYQVSSGTH
ncbi:uncharacterized protein LOC115357512 [Myripristis murdjan]|uniref:uncharacterized protein LOC115357512 n=1 Tax=Myripristis murdjan TaxID=586833 RepID=UPI00117628C2|nr:uncharacterized protein LOC115357512 [Myripristis murdjan]